MKKKDLKRSVGIISMLIYNFIKYFNHPPGLSDNHLHVYYLWERLEDFLYILYPKKSYIQSKLKKKLEDFFGFLFSKEQKMHFLGGKREEDLLETKDSCIFSQLRVSKWTQKMLIA